VVRFSLPIFYHKLATVLFFLLFQFSCIYLLTKIYLFYTFLVADLFVGPLFQILEMNLMPDRELSSVRQLGTSERLFTRGLADVAGNIRHDVIETILSTMPAGKIGKNSAPKSLGRLLYKVNNGLRHRLEGLLIS
jgi:hypothetical protein